MLALDEQTKPDAYYVVVFTSFSNTNLALFSTVFLVSFSMEHETTKSGDEHIYYLKFVPEVFRKAFNNVTALIADSCSTNSSIAIKLNKPLLGWASHLFQLRVWKEIYEKKKDYFQDTHFKG